MYTYAGHNLLFHISMDLDYIKTHFATINIVLLLFDTQTEFSQNYIYLNRLIVENSIGKAMHIDVKPIYSTACTTSKSITILP